MTVAENQDGGYGWVIVASSFTVVFIVDGVLFTFGLLLNVLIDEFEESTASVATMGGLLLGCVALSSPLAGSFSDTFGRRYVTIVGSVIFACGLFTSMFATNIRLLYLTYSIVGGFGFGLMFTPPFASVMEHFDQHRGLAGGIALSGSGVAIFVMNLCTNRLLEDFGWRGTLLVTSGIALNGVPCGLALPQTIRHEPEKNYEGKKLDTCSMLSWCSNMKHVLVRVLIKDNVSVFRNVHPLSFMLCSFAYGLAYYVPFALLPRQAVQLGMTDYEAAWLISTTGITNTISRVVVGWFGNRSFVNRNVMLKIIVLWLALSIFSSVLLTTFKTKLIFAAMYGFAYGSYVCTVPLALVDIVGPEHSGKIMGLVVTMMTGANIIGTPLAGWTVDMTDDFVACFMLAGGETLVALAFLFLPQIRQLCLNEPKTQTTRL